PTACWPPGWAISRTLSPVISVTTGLVAAAAGRFAFAAGVGGAAVAGLAPLSAAASRSAAAPPPSRIPPRGRNDGPDPRVAGGIRLNKRRREARVTVQVSISISCSSGRGRDGRDQRRREREGHHRRELPGPPPPQLVPAVVGAVAQVGYGHQRPAQPEAGA